MNGTLKEIVNSDTVAAVGNLPVTIVLVFCCFGWMGFDRWIDAERIEELSRRMSAAAERQAAAMEEIAANSTWRLVMENRIEELEDDMKQSR